MAQAFARFGARVSLLANHRQILAREDRDAPGRVEREMLRDGVNLLLGSAVLKVEKQGNDKVLAIERAGCCWSTQTCPERFKCQPTRGYDSSSFLCTIRN